MRFNLTDLNSCKVPVSHADAEPPPMELLPDSNLNSPLWVLLYLIPQCPPKPHVLVRLLGVTNAQELDSGL